jgi:hypothetical protein
MAELVIDVDDQAAGKTLAGFGHEVERDLAGELDESIVFCFGNYENALNVGMNACTTYAYVNIGDTSDS